MRYGKITTTLDIDFTETIDSSYSPYDGSIISVSNIDIEKVREDLRVFNVNLVDDRSLKKVEYSIPQGSVVLNRVVKVPLKTEFPEPCRARILGYNLVGNCFESEGKRISLDEELKIKLRDYTAPERDEPFSMDMPVGPHSVQCGLIGRITYSGLVNAVEGAKLVRSVYEVFREYARKVKMGSHSVNAIEKLISQPGAPTLKLLNLTPASETKRARGSDGWTEI